MMKKTIGSMLMGLCAASALNAQSPVTVERQSVQRSGFDLVVNMRVDISNMELGRNRTVVCTPLLEKGDSLLALPPVVVNRRTRQIAYERRDGAALVQPGELAAIRSTIEAVENNKNATITHVSIKGFASPEGAYANNERLAKGRAEALLGYVKGLYDFGGIPCDVASEPEDWQGLETRLAASDIEGREEALAIIRAGEPADPDAREWKLKQL